MADDFSAANEWPATLTSEERLIKAAGFPPDTAPDLLVKTIKDHWDETLFMCRETAFKKAAGGGPQALAVHELLVMAKGQDRSINIPPADDLAVLTLAELFSDFQEAIHAERTATAGIQTRQNFAKDLAALCNGSLPPILADLADRLSRPIDPMTRTGVTWPITHEDYHAAKAKIDTLEVAIRDVCNIDFLFGPALVQFNHWQIYAEFLGYGFATTVTRTGENPPPLRNAMYRFIHAAVPSITGEEPSLAAIRSHLARHRSANYGKHFSLDDLYP